MQAWSQAVLVLQAALLQAHAYVCMAQLRAVVDSHFLIGITGLQSGGKSTLTEHLIGKTVSSATSESTLFACMANTALTWFVLHLVLYDPL